MPRPPAEPARAARDGRRHAACRSLLQNPSSVAASGAPPVRSSGGCALRVNRLTVSQTTRGAVPVRHGPWCSQGTPREITGTVAPLDPTLPHPRDAQRTHCLQALSPRHGTAGIGDVPLETARRIFQGCIHQNRRRYRGVQFHERCYEPCCSSPHLSMSVPRYVPECKLSTECGARRLMLR